MNNINDKIQTNLYDQIQQLQNQVTELTQQNSQLRTSFNQELKYFSEQYQQVQSQDNEFARKICELCNAQDQNKAFLIIKQLLELHQITNSFFNQEVYHNHFDFKSMTFTHHEDNIQLFTTPQVVQQPNNQQQLSPNNQVQRSKNISTQNTPINNLTTPLTIKYDKVKEQQQSVYQADKFAAAFKQTLTKQLNINLTSYTPNQLCVLCEQQNLSNQFWDEVGQICGYSKPYMSKEFYSIYFRRVMFNQLTERDKNDLSIKAQRVQYQGLSRERLASILQQQMGYRNLFYYDILDYLKSLQK
ncbi:Hypothetical_protein [Hexamita inflata]|uniref:Hypothetical_protein n=1 Tax=Hexamita inflata TaxID=28002 RepID=A0AA86UTI5_9EUKA|nr:Hypothetical protein HINF_LOCUS54989 [Hexamita inflata]